MRVMQVHNTYVHRGGEDAVVEAEAALLRSYGHEVRELRASNALGVSAGYLSLVRTLLSSAWNRDVYQRARAVIRDFRPDIVHAHNFWFMLSPSIFGAAHDEGVPTLLTLHNYRLVCPGALLMRGGRICELCLGGSPWHAVPRACYRDSMVQTALLAHMVAGNLHGRTWDELVDGYIVLTDFCRRIFVRGGLPEAKLYVKPNFLHDAPAPATAVGRGAVVVSRLSREKGLHTLLRAWSEVPAASLTIMGDGPERGVLERMSVGLPQVRFLGHVSRADVIAGVKAAACLVLPSEWYECMPIAVLESYACGRPVVASRLGSLVELVREGKTGLLFQHRDAGDLAASMRRLLGDLEACQGMGLRARAEFEQKYTLEINYDRLMSIYQRVIGLAGRK